MIRTNIFFQECDLGTQSVLHAVKTRSRPEIEAKSKRCLETLYDDENVGDVPSKPLSSTLVDLQLKGEERRDSESNIKAKAHFFVHCPECKKVNLLELTGFSIN